ncbi:cobyrinate a,c-diamide synthase [Alkalihalobacterium alkalinitrilicum]|uniref:cobyrinate a,c-diamide synthase n=1 Tax=Alkalihalobacterium alkalinitrilicum TaxID=427920 RepID=UPI000995B3E5|nr:cobyrinate a,c-diamide synthase [Alkalihalobacterium alkalinitrilicum]
MMQRRIVIAGTNSGVGKTTLTIGLMAAFKKKGLTVQGFKCGPDYIDPSYHTAVTGRQSRNVDSWMLEHDIVNDIFVDASQGADLSIIEGVMGFYDGKSPKSNVGSTAEISLLLQAPVILVVNIASMARSAAAIVKGYQMLDPNVNIAGVILNQAGSKGHFELCKTAIEEECDVPVVGYLLKGDGLTIPERHLGLIPAIERGELDEFFYELGDVVADRIDLDELLRISERGPTLELKTDLFSQQDEQEREVKIAVAYDSAFNFYYRENFKLLEKTGAELIFFSPLAGETLPAEVDGLYIGGGFPEEFAKELSENEQAKEDIKNAISNGLPTFAECGGFMYLTESIASSEGETFPMVGVIPGKVKMQERLAALGYRQVTAIDETFLFKKGEEARGHEFHYSTFESDKEFEKAYYVKALRGEKEEGYRTDNIVAGYTHIHFASNPKVAASFVEKCVQYKEKNKDESN